MGVPKFFRYMSERYPCLNEKLKEFQVPEFDNLYLDMNGIIHVCSHNDDPLLNIPEEIIFKDIFNYIELMFRIVQPKKLFMMAVDGVAPRAKMNQQRGRRFRAAKDAELAATRATSSGLPQKYEDRFDSNCITPGTEFMDRLQQQLKYFVMRKISTDKLWQRPKIILSGHDTPGEGEHKIMDYIRYLRSQDDWEPNTRHCLHGLDADLIMLGLCSHELHFSLLREEVKFGRNQKRPANPEEIQYCLLHLSILRDYLDLEFQALKNTLPFPYDLEKIVDDWVLMGFLVGNDFIPNLPSLHIKENALHYLYQLYIEVLPTLGGYINDSGVLNIERFEKYMKKLAELDFEHFQEIESDHRYFEAKTGGNKRFRKSMELDDIGQDEELMNLINSTKSALCDNDEHNLISWDSPTSEDDVTVEFKKYKDKYYMEKMEFKEVTDEILRSQAECYIRAIQWNLHYYYHGCPSWSWYYPYHYAPFISDIKDFAYLGQMEFDLGKPFTPFQQLLAVLPPASRKILPKAFQDLMISPQSAIVDFYPEDFQTDLNGKQHDWEAVVLLPFIDQEVLTKAMEPHYENLSGDEKRRNAFGPMKIFEYTKEDLGPAEAPEYFPRIDCNHAKETAISSIDIRVPFEKLKWGLLPGAIESFWYGFPTLKNIEFTAKLVEAKVNVFNMPSRGLNMMLYLKGVRSSNDDTDTAAKSPQHLEGLAKKYLGKVINVGWPHLVKAFATCVTDLSYKYALNNEGTMQGSDLTKEELYQWSLHGNELSIKHRSNLGIEIGFVDVIIFAKPLVGSRYQFSNKGIAEKKVIWSSQAIPYPLQLVVDNIKILPCDKMCGGEPSVKPWSEVLPTGQVAFLMTPQNYGAQVKVLEECENGSVKVELCKKAEPNIDSINQLRLDNMDYYYSVQSLASKMGITNIRLLSVITGVVLVQTAENIPSAKVNIGLNLKLNKSNQQVVGYTKKNGKVWIYSDKVIELIKEYQENFPEVFNQLNTQNKDVFMKTDFFEKDADERMAALIKWLTNHPCFKSERRSINSELLSENAITELEKIIKSNNWRNETFSTIEVNPNHLQLPLQQVILMEPDSSATHQLLDRVVNIRECHSIPLGMKGFIIGIEKKENDQGTLYDILFDVPIIGGFQLLTEDKRCYRLTKHAFINLSHGCRQQLNENPAGPSQCINF